jgi:ruvB-like 1
MYLAELGTRTTLRYVTQLLNPASHLARIYQANSVEVRMIKEASELFHDVKQSSKILIQENDKFMK